MTMWKNGSRPVITGAALALLMFGCSKHTIDVQPIRVEPIHMTLDVNIRVDRELDQFFDFEEDVVVTPATQPATIEPTTTRPETVIPGNGGV